jgi:hypothetical protein
MSNILGHTEISNKELLVWLKVLKEDGYSKEEMLDELELIDRLLICQKTYMLLNRKRGLGTQLEAIIGHHLGHKQPINLNTKG